ncbi:sugar ABC transporter ATP-binding protein [Pantoea sp. Acro-805]|uniref:Sugar ABC transporter ATP-binding protein n=1 Tax=Candidatus Pantoea formicae TaxID=2608355 RepID=A0ABX0QTQ9_9GAMM|nr:sugar ABC transporter ATP-binding protein [Pantoea formicae]MDF7649726.1 sugar ABC transporter ATP-binding protein [Erwiniaceae bacterium L1_54_3]NIF00439.1 sugar ABC transporter ATP-binding protein [Pantoea formicae]
MTALLELRGISKRFGAVKALQEVDLTLQAGEIHALAGENGAGKSTLMNIIDGILRPDSGEIWLDGKPVTIRSPREAQQLGIGLVHQEIALCPDISIYENIWMAHQQRGLLLPHKALRERAQQVMNRLAPIPVSQKVGELSLSQQQLVEIAKALTLDCRLLILDEPTAALTEPEAQTLFSIVRQLRDQGITVVYISHRMAEIFALCQHITILRDGRTVHSAPLHSMTADEVITRLVGRELSQLYPDKRPVNDTPPLLEVRNLSDGKRFHDIHFNLRPGEILGIGGLMGAGRSEIAQGICALHPITRGSISIKGLPVRLKDYAASIQQRMVYLSEDRKDAGLFLAMPIDWNISALDIRAVSHHGLTLSPRRERVQAEALAQQVKLKRGKLSDPVSSLSGGNQQKVALARVLSVQPEIVFLDEPTRGVDVSAKAEIYQILANLADNGVGLVVISSELPELIGLCDRIIVIHEGRISGEVTGEAMTEENLMRLAAGIATQAEAL